MKIFIALFLATIVVAKEISQEYVLSNNLFAVDVHRQLVKKTPNKNVVFSTYSLETLLALTSLGAKGDTASEIKKVLHLTDSDEEIKAKFNSAQTELEQVKHLTVSPANRIYLRNGIAIETDFAKTASESFRASLENIDFGANVKASQEINSWVENKTDHKIKDLIKEDQLSQLTQMVLVNALYFKGSWQVPFNPEHTSKQDFHLSQTQKVQVDTMKVTGSLFRYRSDKHKSTIFRLPYAGTQNRGFLDILIPDDINEMNQVEHNLEAIVKDQKFIREHLRLYLPKFRAESSIDFKPILTDMGITKLFNKPDLKGISEEELVVDSINQKTFIEVDEFGTVAASATAEIANARILLRPKEIPVEYHVDRPFIFAIVYDHVALISGKIMNPLEG